MSIGLGMTNATKAIVGGLVASALALVTAFGLELSTEQVGAINAFASAALSAWVALSYTQSPKRVESEELATALSSTEEESVALSADDLEYAAGTDRPSDPGA